MARSRIELPWGAESPLPVRTGRRRRALHQFSSKNSDARGDAPRDRHHPGRQMADARAADGLLQPAARRLCRHARLAARRRRRHPRRARPPDRHRFRQHLVLGPSRACRAGPKRPSIPRSSARSSSSCSASRPTCSTAGTTRRCSSPWRRSCDAALSRGAGALARRDRRTLRRARSGASLHGGRTRDDD